MPTHDWQSWLTDWNKLLLEHLDPREADADVPPDVIASGWLGAPGASEDEVSRLEARLGVQFPPSYRDFLKVSNGFRQPGLLVPRLFSTNEVDWYRVCNQEAIDLWTKAVESYGDWLEHDLPYALEISAQEVAGTAVYLLNPRVVHGDGEWEAWYFAHWIPGAERYDSFWELMQHERETYLYLLNHKD